MNQKSMISFNCGVALLNNKTYYSQSVHCFYFSLIQLMKFKLASLKTNAISYSEQSEKSKNESSHRWLSEQIYLNFANKKNGNNFLDVFNRLKSYRVVSDYGERHLTQEECADCRTLRETAAGYLRDIK